MSRQIISVVGSGVVGQATGKGFISHGFTVQFVDIRPEVIVDLNKQGYQAYTPEELESVGDQSGITVFTVSTPTHNGEINLVPLSRAAADLGRRLAKRDTYHLVVVRSTVVPGTTEDLIIPIIEKESGKKAGRDFGVCMNPEYLREISAEEDFAQPWLITIGQLDQKSGDTLARVYEKYNCPKYRLRITEAEMQKYVHNLFNAHKIAFFNEMRGVCEKIGIDADEIFPIVAKSAEGMWNPAYGIKNFGPFDGMCLPKDTQAMLAWAAKRDWDMPVLATVVAANNELLAAKQKTSISLPEQLAIQQAAV